MLAESVYLPHICSVKHETILYNEAERLSLSVTNPNEMISLAGNCSQLVYLAWRDSSLPRSLDLKYIYEVLKRILKDIQKQ